MKNNNKHVIGGMKFQKSKHQQKTTGQNVCHKSIFDLYKTEIKIK